jgi:hypothetical protein
MTAITKGKSIVIQDIAAIGYRVYSASVTQVGTNAPTASILQNTLNCNITWTYISSGVYKGTSTGAFPLGRTLIYLGSNRGAGTTTIITTTTQTVNDFLIECNDGDGSNRRLTNKNRSLSFSSPTYTYSICNKNSYGYTYCHRYKYGHTDGNSDRNIYKHSTVTPTVTPTPTTP